MTLIGISGKKQSGKTTVAELIASLALPHTTDHINFADSLKDELCKMLGISRSYLELHKDNFRLMMQGYGTDYKRKLVSDGYWIEKYGVAVLKSKSDVVVTSDVRFKNEYEFIKHSGGILIRVARATINDDKHVSETMLDSEAFDYAITNDGSLEDLRNKVSELYNKIRK